MRFYHADFLEMLDPEFDYKQYYQSVKDYISQNGFFTYGIVVQGYPEKIAELTKIDQFSHIFIEDIKMALPF